MPMKIKWRKAPQALVDLFSAVLPDDPRVETRKMFGYPCAFTSGNMFIALHQENMVLRLPGVARVEFLKLKGASIFEPMPAHLMREYVVVPAGLIAAPARLKTWVARALEYAAGLPRKVPNKAAGRKAR